MKKIIVLISCISITIGIYSCGGNNEEADAFDKRQKELMLNDVFADQHVEAGDGNIESDDTTPINKRLIVQYINDANEVMTVETTFDAQAKGTVIINRPGQRPLKLEQLGDAWANGASYSDGITTWTATKTIGTLTESGKSIEYRILEKI